MSMSSSINRKRERDDDTQNNGGNGDDECLDMVEGLFENNKKAKGAANDSPSNSSSVDNGSSPSPGVNSKSSSSKPNSTLDKIIRSLPFSDEDGESRIMKRLKVLCSTKEPTVNVGIEMVGATYLLMKLKRCSCHEIENAMEKAVAAAIVLFDADHLLNNGLQLLSETQKSIEKAL